MSLNALTFVVRFCYFGIYQYLALFAIKAIVSCWFLIELNETDVSLSLMVELNVKHINI